MTSVPTLCEMTTYILVTQPVYADIHPGLVTIPLDMEQEFTVPCGLMIANDPSPGGEAVYFGGGTDKG